MALDPEISDAPRIRMPHTAVASLSFFRADLAASASRRICTLILDDFSSLHD